MVIEPTRRWSLPRITASDAMQARDGTEEKGACGRRVWLRKPQGVQLGTAEEAKEDDAKETTQLEYADTEQAAAAKREQKIAENALEHQAEAGAENHAEEIRRRTPLEVVVDVSAHPQELPQCAVRLMKWKHWSRAFSKPKMTIQHASCKHDSKKHRLTVRFTN